MLQVVFYHISLVIRFLKECSEYSFIGVGDFFQDRGFVMGPITSFNCI